MNSPPQDGEMSKLIHIEERDTITVGWAKGFSHRLYEDRYRILTKGVPIVSKSERGEVFAVLDGMGGLRHGMQAAQIIADALISYYEESDSLPEGAVGLGCLLDEVSAELANRNWERGDDEDSFKLEYGAAGTICLLMDKKLHIFHAGDTEGWLHQRGRWFKVTNEEGGGQKIDNFFGLPFERGFEVQTNTLEFQPGDTMLLYSDGLPKGVTRDHILGAALAKDLNHSMERLLAKAHPKSGDDLTMMVMRS